MPKPTSVRSAVSEPSPLRLLTMFAVALFGLAVSVFLLAGYLQMTEIPCTDTGCDLVRIWHDRHFPKASMPALGSLYFLVLAVLSTMLGYADEKKSRPLSNATLGLSVLGGIFVAILTYIEAAVIHSFCFWCLMIAGAAILFLILAIRERASWKADRRRYDLEFEPFVKWGAAPLALVFLLASGMEPHAVMPTDENSITPSTVLTQGVFTRPYSHARGPENAPVEIVEFADPGCPSCAQESPIMEQLLKKYPDQIHFVYRHFPLKSHTNSRLAAQAMESAGEQGKFWEYHDILFKNTEAQTKPFLIKYAQSLKLEMKKFNDDLNSGKFVSRVDTDRDDGEHLKIFSTPRIFINKTITLGPTNFETLENAFKSALEMSKVSK